MRVGVNFWHAMWLGAEAPLGDPDRLRRELDTLAERGLSCVRLMVGAEGPNDAEERVAPALQPEPGVWDRWLLDGLGVTLDELAARDMSAIACLTNFWWWSGGLSQYRAWAGAGEIPRAGYDEFERFSAGFYRDAGARALFDAHVDVVVSRYAGHRALLAWEVCNEARGKHDPEGMRSFLVETARYVRSIDPATPVASGSEGSTAHPERAGLDFADDHRDPSIDLATCHLWLQNWGLWDPAADDDGRFEEALGWSREYLRRHARAAAALGKPLWIEEIGLARDGGRFDAGATTTRRDRFFDEMLTEARALESQGLPVAGLLAWAWTGEGGERIGDPPHEPPGWYGIAARDTSTLGVLSRHATGVAQKERAI